MQNEKYEKNYKNCVFVQHTPSGEGKHIKHFLKTAPNGLLLFCTVYLYNFNLPLESGRK